MSGARGTDSQQQDRRNAADHARNNPAGDRGTKSQQQDRRNMEAARRAGNAAPGVGTNRDRGTLSQQQDRINMNRALARSNTAPGVGNYSDAMDDYNNINQGFFDDPLGWLGRQFAGGFGVGEIDPRTQAPKSFRGRNTASWGVDPIGAALGLGGMFSGPAGMLASGLYNRGLGIAGVQGPMIAFDGNQPVTGPFSGLGGSSSPSGTAGPSMAGHAGPSMAGQGSRGGGYGSYTAPQVASASRAGAPNAAATASPAGIPNSWAPGIGLQSGLPGYGTYRPGYTFMGPSSATPGIGARMFQPVTRR